MESSKKIPGKISSFGERIIKVLIARGLQKPNGDVNYAEAERRAELKGTVLSKAVTANGMHDGNLDKFLRTFKVDRGWLLTGSGSMEPVNNNEKHTSVQNEATVREKDLRGDPEVYRTIVEGNTEYVLVPRTVMEDSKLIAKDQFTETIEMMKSDRRIMEILINKFVETADKLVPTTKPMESQKGK